MRVNFLSSSAHSPVFAPADGGVALPQVKADERHSFAVTFAQKAKNSKALDDILRKYANSKEEIKKGAVNALVALSEIYGDDMDKLPVPGSENTIETPNGRPDYYKTFATEDGVTRQVDGSVYQDIADAIGEGPELIEYAGKLKAAKADKADAVAEYKGWGKARLEAEIDRIRERRGNRAQVLRKAVSIRLQMMAIGEKCPMVLVDFQTDEKTGKLLDTTKPFFVQSRKSQGITKSIGTTTLLSFDPAVAAAKGGDFEALMGSVTKKVKTPAAVGAKRITTPEQAVDYLGELVAYLDIKDNRIAFMAMLSKEGSDDAVWNVGTLYGHLDDFASKTERRFEHLAASKLADKDKAA